MPLVSLEIDLGQVNTFDATSNIIKISGLVVNNKLNTRLASPIHLINRPFNNEFSIKKTGNSLGYMLVLSLEKL